MCIIIRKFTPTQPAWKKAEKILKKDLTDAGIEAWSPALVE
ncbi:MAG: hypothetical protein ACK518_03525 [bacterium]